MTQIYLSSSIGNVIKWSTFIEAILIVVYVTNVAFKNTVNCRHNKNKNSTINYDTRHIGVKREIPLSYFLGLPIHSIKYLSSYIRIKYTQKRLDLFLTSSKHLTSYFARMIWKKEMLHLPKDTKIKLSSFLKTNFRPINFYGMTQPVFLNSSSIVTSVVEIERSRARKQTFDLHTILLYCITCCDQVCGNFVYDCGQK